MPKRRLSYAERINSAKLLAEGVRKHLAELKQVGIDEPFVTELEKWKEIVEDLNVEQERLKAELKDKTVNLKKELRKMNSMVSKGRKLVKIEIVPSQWKEFGIEDVR